MDDEQFKQLLKSVRAIAAGISWIAVMMCIVAMRACVGDG